MHPTAANDKGTPDPQMRGVRKKAKTDKGRDVAVWIAPEDWNEDIRYFCHGESLRTFQLYGYTPYSGDDIGKVLRDEYVKVPAHSLQREDILAFTGPANAGEWRQAEADAEGSRQVIFILCHTARVITPHVVHGKIDEARTLVRTKNGWKAPAEDSTLVKVMGFYGESYEVYRSRKKTQ